MLKLFKYLKGKRIQPRNERIIINLSIDEQGTIYLKNLYNSKNHERFSFFEKFTVYGIVIPSWDTQTTNYLWAGLDKVRKVGKHKNPSAMVTSGVSLTRAAKFIGVTTESNLIIRRRKENAHCSPY